MQWKEQLTIKKGSTASFMIHLGQGADAVDSASIEVEDDSIVSINPTQVTTPSAITVTGLTPGTTDITVSFNGGIAETVAVTVESVTPSWPAGSGCSSGGSTYTPTYAVNFSQIEHGSVDLLKETVAVGEIVKFTLKADEGYQIDTLVVKDANGNQNSDLSQFSDSDHITDYAKEAMAWAIEKGIISGVGDAKLAPKTVLHGHK